MTTTTAVDVTIRTDEGGKAPVGIVDADGVLWKATKVGSFKTDLPDAGLDTCWATLEHRCKATPARHLVAKRPVLAIDLENGFEKFTLGPYHYTTCAQYMGRVESFAAGLKAIAGPLLDVTPFVVIYAQTQLEWMLAAYATWRQGLTVVTIYDTLGAEGAAHGLNQSKASTVVTDAKLLKTLAKVAAQCPSLKHVITITDEVPAEQREALEKAGITITPMSAVEAKGSAAPTPPTPSPERSAVAVLMFTSGTTGAPKGVEITHGNMIAIMAAVFSPTGALLSWPEKFKFDLKQNPTYLAYLPLAHIMELSVEVTLMYFGATLCYGSPHTLTPTGIKMKQTKPPQQGDAMAARPTLMVFAPAVLDKVYAKVNSNFAAASGLIQSIVKGGLAKGAAHYDRGGVGTTDCIAKLIFKKVQKLLGGRVQFALTGSAPLAPDVQRWVQTVFNAPCRQGYGLTETCAATCVSVAKDNTVSVVGPPQECACLRLRDWPEGGYFNDDVKNSAIGMRRGEILIGGPGVSKGYYVDPANPDPELVEKNQTDYIVIGGIRYFCTGDIGQFTPSGNVQIIDRKKDLVKLQQGEYVALSKVENVLKTSKYVELPMAYAASTESTCIALICPMAPALRALATSLGIPKETSHEDLCTKHKAVNEAVLADVQKCCKGKLVGFETPAKVILIADLWTVENDMLTAALKLKRKPIVDRHKADIEAIGYGLK